MSLLKDKKGQMLIFVFFIMLIIGIFTGGLVSMWQPELHTRIGIRDSSLAFYLAQAGIERAKVELAHNWDYSGGCYNYAGGRYCIGVISLVGNRKRIVSTGEIGDSRRRISLELDQHGRRIQGRVCGYDIRRCGWYWQGYWRRRCGRNPHRCGWERYCYWQRHRWQRRRWVCRWQPRWCCWYEWDPRWRRIARYCCWMEDRWLPGVRRDTWREE